MLSELPATGVAAAAALCLAMLRWALHVLRAL
jgi:hypothetical protein